MMNLEEVRRDTNSVTRKCEVTVHVDQVSVERMQRRKCCLFL